MGPVLSGRYKWGGVGKDALSCPSLLRPLLMPILSLHEDNLSHRPLASHRSGEIFTQDVRPEQLLEGKVRFALGSVLQALAESGGL